MNLIELEAFGYSVWLDPEAIDSIVEDKTHPDSQCTVYTHVFTEGVAINESARSVAKRIGIPRYKSASVTPGTIVEVAKCSKD